MFVRFGRIVATTLMVTVTYKLSITAFHKGTV